MAKAAASLTVIELREAVIRSKEIAKQIDDLKTLKAKEDEKIIATLGVKGSFVFELYKATVVQQWRRKIDWKGTAVRLARKFYDQVGFRNWVRNLAKNHAKEASAPYVLITAVKKNGKNGNGK